MRTNQVTGNIIVSTCCLGDMAVQRQKPNCSGKYNTEVYNYRSIQVSKPLNPLHFLRYIAHACCGGVLRKVSTDQCPYEEQTPLYTRHTSVCRTLLCMQDTLHLCMQNTYMMLLAA